MKKKWCKHITWTTNNSVGVSWWRFHTVNNCITVENHWKVCPICEAERPTKSNIASARLRAAMDND